MSGPIALKGVLSSTPQPHVRERLADLLQKLMAHGLQRMLAELDINAQRPVKERLSEFVSSEPSTRRRSGPWISAIALTYGQP